MLRDAKRLGFSDQAIGKLAGAPRRTVRAARKAHGIEPHFAQIDTMAAEFPADTNYLYATYHASASDVAAVAAQEDPDARLGHLPHRLERRVRLVRVNAAQAAAALGYETIMLNYNPETVSTDYDICDRLYFDEISLETVLDLYEHERPDGVVVSMGGQIPNNLAMRLAKAGVQVLGTSAESIDNAEDRTKFSALLDELGIDQPRWAHVTDAAEADRIVEQLGGFPVLVRPSYVLSGAAMAWRTSRTSCAASWRAPGVSPEHPVVVSKFEIARARDRDRRGRRPGRAGAVGDLRAHRGRRRAQRRRDAGAAAADALHRDDPPRPADRDDARARARDHRPVQRPVPRPAQRGQGHRVQPARLAQLSRSSPR